MATHSPTPHTNRNNPNPRDSHTAAKTIITAVVCPLRTQAIPIRMGRRTCAISPHRLPLCYPPGPLRSPNSLAQVPIYYTTHVRTTTPLTAHYHPAIVPQLPRIGPTRVPQPPRIHRPTVPRTPRVLPAAAPRTARGRPAYSPRPPRAQPTCPAARTADAYTLRVVACHGTGLAQDWLYTSGAPSTCCCKSSCPSPMLGSGFLGSSQGARYPRGVASGGLHWPLT